MKKVFPLSVAGKDAPRVVEAIKNDVRKYVKRERRKELPEGFTAWEFDCKVGAASDSAEPKAIADLSAAIDATAASGSEQVYVEILARPGYRFKAPEPTAPPPVT